MGQRRAFRSAGRARGELDVDRIVELQRRAEVGERPARFPGRGPGTSSKLSIPGVFSGPRRITISSFGSLADASLPGMAESISGATERSEAK